MDEELSALVREIITIAKERGLTQKDIARLTQTDEVTLSRAKTVSDIKYSTLKAWAKVVGLRVTLVADSPLAEKVRKGELFDD